MFPLDFVHSKTDVGGSSLAPNLQRILKRGLMRGGGHWRRTLGKRVRTKKVRKRSFLNLFCSKPWKSHELDKIPYFIEYTSRYSAYTSKYNTHTSRYNTHTSRYSIFGLLLQKFVQLLNLASGHTDQRTLSTTNCRFQDEGDDSSEGVKTSNVGKGVQKISFFWENNFASSQTKEFLLLRLLLLWCFQSWSQ